jgi:transposase
MKLREMKLRVRELSEDERATIATWCGTQAGSVRLRDRATIIAWSAEGWWVSDIARIVRVTPQVVRKWIKRFNAEGLDGLKDQPRSGRPATYTAEQIGEVVTAALTKPETLGLPFASWTLDRLAAYLAEERGLPIKRSRIDEVLIAEGLRWRHQETWFGERVDPAFAEKRGPLSPSTPRHLQEVS